MGRGSSANGFVKESELQGCSVADLGCCKKDREEGFRITTLGVAISWEGRGVGHMWSFLQQHISIEYLGKAIKLMSKWYCLAYNSMEDKDSCS